MESLQGMKTSWSLVPLPPIASIFSTASLKCTVSIYVAFHSRAPFNGSYSCCCRNANSLAQADTGVGGLRVAACGGVLIITANLDGKVGDTY